MLSCDAAFPDGKYKRLPDEVYKRLEFHPASFEVKEHHIAVYAGMDNETIVKAERPKDLLRGSIATPSPEAATINGKYVNSPPLYRIGQEFKRNDVNLNRQNMANWTIQCADRYLAIMYDHLHKLLYGYHVLQADETLSKFRKMEGPLAQRALCGFTGRGNPIRKPLSCMNTRKTGKRTIRRSS